jgi:hypothetical protein
MGYLYDELRFAPGSRLTGVWTLPDRYEADTSCLAYGQLVRLGSGQDPEVESDFLSAHLPFAVGGLHGVGPDGEPWTYLLQAMPADAARLVDTANDYWPMVDAVERALRFNYSAGRTWVDQGWTRDGLVAIYRADGIDEEELVDWSVVELLKGLLAECCYVPLRWLVEGRARGCAFPDIEHDCQLDVFSDAFALWTTGVLSPPEPVERGTGDEDEEDDDEVGGPRHLPPITTGYAWPRKRLRRWKTLKLRLVAVEEGWSVKRARRMTRKQLIRALATPHRRRVRPVRAPSR